MLGRLWLKLLRRRDPIAHARALGVRVGENCRLIDVSFSTEPYLIRLGNHVSATKTRFETHDGGVWVLRGEHPNLDVVRGITVGDNVFFGYGCIVLPGVTVGSNVVVGAGSVVTKDVPSNSIAAGVPARVIGNIEAYRAKSLARGAMSKAMTPTEKKAFYLTADNTQKAREDH